MNAKNWVSVVIPVWAANETTMNCTIACVSSVAKCATEYPTELVIVDNASGGPERSAIKKKLNEINSAFQSVKYLQLSENTGFVKGTNLGLDLSDGDQILLLNNDTILPRMAIKRLSHTQKYTRAWAVGPLCRIKTNPERSSWQSIDRCKRLGMGIERLPKYDDKDLDGYNEILWKADNLRPMYPKMLAFFCTMFPALTFDRVGYLDEIYGCGLGDDDDFCKRIRMCGGKLYLEPRVLIEHHHRTSFKLRTKLTGINYMKEGHEHLQILKNRYGGL